MARTHYIAGNWKMNTTKAEAVALAKDLVEQLKGKRLQEYQAEALAEEQKMLDEIGLQLTMRKKAGQA